jgi:hypothetical protein
LDRGAIHDTDFSNDARRVRLPEPLHHGRSVGSNLGPERDSVPSPAHAESAPRPQSPPHLVNHSPPQAERRHVPGRTGLPTSPASHYHGEFHHDEALGSWAEGCG